MNEKIKSFFAKIGMCLVAGLFLLAVFFRDRFQNKRIGVESDSGRIGDPERNRERAKQSADTIAEIVARVKERGGEPEEESSGL